MRLRSSGLHALESRSLLFKVHKKRGYEWEHNYDHFSAPSSRWSFTCSRWAGVFSTQGVGGVLLGSIRSLLKANRGAPCGRSFWAGLSKLAVEGSRSIVAVAFERRTRRLLIRRRLRLQRAEKDGDEAAQVSISGTGTHSQTNELPQSSATAVCCCYYLRYSAIGGPSDSVRHTGGTWGPSFPA